jgi:hypothetical protein
MVSSATWFLVGLGLSLTFADRVESGAGDAVGAHALHVDPHQRTPEGVLPGHVLVGDQQPRVEELADVAAAQRRVVEPLEQASRARTGGKRQVLLDAGGDFLLALPTGCAAAAAAPPGAGGLMAPLSLCALGASGARLLCRRTPAGGAPRRAYRRAEGSGSGKGR